MTVQTIRDSIVVRKEEVAEKTASGLFIGHVEDKNAKGTVIAVGTGRVSMTGVVIPLDVKAGDRITFNKTNTTEIKEDGETLLVMREDNIVCIHR